MKRNFWMCLLIGVLLYGCAGSNAGHAPVAVRWEMGTNDVEKGYYDNSFVIKNISGHPLDDQWTIYYSQLPHTIRQPENSPVKIEVINGCYYKMYPTSYYNTIQPGDSLKITFLASYSLIKNSHAPEGVYMVAKKDGKDLLPVAVPFTKIPLSGKNRKGGEKGSFYANGEQVYEDNLRFSEPVQLGIADIFPSVKKCDLAGGQSVIYEKVALKVQPEFENEGKILEEKLSERGIEVRPEASQTFVLETLPEEIVPVNEEFYRLIVADNRIKIQGNTGHAVFNGIQTLLAVLKNKTFPCEIENLCITDYPDLLYRGQMLDVARNFTGKADLLKLIDLMSSYKLNVLHFHFTDDEGWRLEIPGLEELTAVASRRGHTLDESECLYPAYDGCFDPNDTLASSNGFYTQEDFIEVLKYADARHIQIIPEIESPGHARAAIVAMKARYRKYAATDREKATEYLLSDCEDTSVYSTAQAYTDNVMNVAMPSVYQFFDKVTDELMKMYAEAGLRLETLHIGGDEVPSGVWEGSPVCCRMMEEKGMKDIHDLSEYFLTHITDMLVKKGIKVSGWQEIALNHDEATDRELSKNVAGVYCWDTSPNGENEEVPYLIANKEYPVILCNVNNFYVDMAYDRHPDEPGLYWGGFVSEYVSYNMLPYRVYLSSRTEGAEQGKVRLTARGRRYIKGIQAQLFAETIRNFEGVEYCIFPKVFGLVERGWNTVPEWSEITDPLKAEEAYRQALSVYNAKITQGEMPRLRREKVNFRIGQPGLRLEDGKLYANSPIKGAEIRYTTDGSEPSQTSALWTTPVACDAFTVKAKLFYEGKESVTTWLR